MKLYYKFYLGAIKLVENDLIIIQKLSDYEKNENNGFSSSKKFSKIILREIELAEKWLNILEDSECFPFRIMEKHRGQISMLKKEIQKFVE